MWRPLGVFLWCLPNSREFKATSLTGEGKLPNKKAGNIKYINLQTFLNPRLTQALNITPVCKLYRKIVETHAVHWID